MPRTTPSPVRVALEIGPKRTFATALDWPGWCRGARNEIDAVDALLAHASRYAAVLSPTGLLLPADPVPEVVERLTGGTGTDFGAPGVPAVDERRATSADDGARLADILAACWEAFDVIADNSPEELRKGPRGGGRDRTKIVAHVAEAELHYARRLGVRHRAFAPDDRPALDALRADMLAVIRTPTDGEPVVEKGWTIRFAARYIAWHVLDHGWEIEDRRT